MKIDQSVAAGGAGMLLVIILTWACQQFAHVAIPTEVGMALGGLIQLAVTHFVPSSPRDAWTPEQRAAAKPPAP